MSNLDYKICNGITTQGFRCRNKIKYNDSPTGMNRWKSGVCGRCVGQAVKPAVTTPTIDIPACVDEGDLASEQADTATTTLLVDSLRYMNSRRQTIVTDTGFQLNIDIRRRRSSVPGERGNPPVKTRIYVSHADESIMEHLSNRHNRPYTLYRKEILPHIRREMDIPDDVKIRWNRYAGCSMCPCSPGFVVDGLADSAHSGFDIFIDAEEAVPRTTFEDAQ